MATYNGGRYLQDQLLSFVNQTVQPDELVICDDGSTDNTIDIIKSFIKTAPFEVLFFKNEDNLGYAQNFSKAIGLSKGDLIFLSDQDDIWLTYKIERMVNYFNKNSKMHVFLNDAQLIDGDLNKSPLTKLGQIKNGKYPISSFVQGSCTCITGNMKNIVLPVPDNINGHDNWISDIARFLNMRIIIDEVLQLYRIHDSNTSPYVTNQLKKVNITDRVLDKIKNSKLETRANFGYEINYYSALLERLSCYERAISGNEMLNQNNSNAVGNISQYIKALKIRDNIYNQTFIKRLIGAVKMYDSGIYNKYFCGNYSLIRDIVKL